MNQTVLLVDDDPHVLSGLVRVLRKEPYHIETATSAEEAARVLAERPVDLIVTDEEMPGMTGTEFLARVAEEYPDTIRMVLTGHPTVPAALRAINEGKVDQFFTKPCNEIDLALAIRTALARKAQAEAPAAPRPSLVEEARLVRRMRGEAASETQEPPPSERPPLGVEVQELIQRRLRGEKAD